MCTRRIRDAYDVSITIIIILIRIDEFCERRIKCGDNRTKDPLFVFGRIFGNRRRRIRYYWPNPKPVELFAQPLGRIPIGEISSDKTAISLLKHVAIIDCVLIQRVLSRYAATTVITIIIIMYNIILYIARITFASCNYLCRFCGGIIKYMYTVFVSGTETHNAENMCRTRERTNKKGIKVCIAKGVG